MCHFVRSCEDEIDFAEAEQLHEAALQISKTCFDLKKLCVTFLGAAMVFLIEFTEKHVDHSLFVVGLVLICGFWMSDVTAYFYQRRVRSAISERFAAIGQRHQTTRSHGPGQVGVLGAVFNGSMVLYFVLALLFIGAWISFCQGWIR